MDEMTLKNYLNAEEVSYLENLLEAQTCQGRYQVSMIAGIYNFIDWIKSNSVAPPRLLEGGVATVALIDANLMGPIRLRYPNVIMKHDIIENGNEDGDNLIWNFYIVDEEVTHTIPMTTQIGQADYTELIEAISKVVDETRNRNA